MPPSSPEKEHRESPQVLPSDMGKTGCDVGHVLEQFKQRKCSSDRNSMPPLVEQSRVAEEDCDRETSIHSDKARDADAASTYLLPAPPSSGHELPCSDPGSPVSPATEEGTGEQHSVLLEEAEVVIESDASFEMPGLGADVLVCDQEVVLEQQQQPGEQNQVVYLQVPNTTEVTLRPGSRIDYSRRVSYEEMIHSEESDAAAADGRDPKEDVAAGSGNAVEGCEILSEGCATKGAGNNLCPPTLVRCLVVLTQWALTLQEVYEDRQSSGLNPSSTKCLCSKAETLRLSLKGVETVFYQVIELQDRSAYSDDGARLASGVHEMQAMLKTSVSIQISNPSEDVKSKASFLVGEVCDVRQYVRDATDSLVRLVLDLLNVPECKEEHGMAKEEVENEEGKGVGLMEVDEEEEIATRVASMKTEDEDEDGDDEEEDDEDEDFFEEDDKENVSCRKRKQSKPKSPPTSPTSSPSKRPRRNRTLSAPGRTETNILELLEKKRKGVRQNGLLQFILWREALRAEKDRKMFDEQKAAVTNRRRLSFNP